MVKATLYSICTLSFIMTLHVLSIGQESVTRPVCGHDWVMQSLDIHSPGLADAIRQQYASIVNTKGGFRSNYTIPVVLHIVWRDSAENLSDELIASQIASLNKDFSYTNDDKDNLRPIFQDVAGDAGIQFDVKAINRVKTDKLFSVNLLTGALATSVKYTDQGGSDAWDPDYYLNIWICKIQPITIGPLVLGQILGFAFPPTGLTHWPEGANAPQKREDGVVIDYRMWGLNNPNPISVPGSNQPLVVKGRTPTHEIGHYLGLRHIWGDGGLLGPNDCNQSDGVDDTPFASEQSPFNCDPTRNSCNKLDDYYGMDMPDLIENYMDYSSEDCMNMFTKGQVAIMHYVLEGPRKGLIEGPSQASIPVGTYRLQAKVYPNPGYQRINIALSSSVTESMELQLYAITGNTPVASKTVPADNHLIEWEIPKLPGGIYILRTGSNQIQPERIILLD